MRVGGLSYTYKNSQSGIPPHTHMRVICFQKQSVCRRYHPHKERSDSRIFLLIPGWYIYFSLLTILHSYIYYEVSLGCCCDLSSWWAINSWSYVWISFMLHPLCSAFHCEMKGGCRGGETVGNKVTGPSQKIKKDNLQCIHQIQQVTVDVMFIFMAKIHIG